MRATRSTLTVICKIIQSLKRSLPLSLATPSRTLSIQRQWCCGHSRPFPEQLQHRLRFTDSNSGAVDTAGHFLNNLSADFDSPIERHPLYYTASHEQNDPSAGFRHQSIKPTQQVIVCHAHSLTDSDMIRRERHWQAVPRN